MKEELVSFKISKLAKEVGFNEPCREAYGINEDVKDVHYMWRRFYTTNQDIDSTEIETRKIRKELFPDEIYEPDFVCTAPTQSLLQRWIREKHDINVLVSFDTIDDSETAYIWNIIEYIEEGKDRKKDTWDFYNRIDSFDKMMWYDTYEQALEAGLEKSLNIIKEHN